MKRVCIVDYGLCNLDSIVRAVEECDARATVTSAPRVVAGAERLILPGVGAFADAMKNLHQRGLVEVLRERVLSEHVPFLGICLGMQLLASFGEEGGRTAGLNLIEGEVVRLSPSPPKAGEPIERVPHVGWNEVYFQADEPLFQGIVPGKDFYFVHSFHFKTNGGTNGEVSIAQTPYCGTFTSAVRRGLLWGVQFHPEKSQKPGMRLLHNFLGI